MRLPRQEYWSGLPFPTSEDLPDPGREHPFPESPALSHLGSHTIYLHGAKVKVLFFYFFYGEILSIQSTEENLIVEVFSCGHMTLIMELKMVEWLLTQNI